MKELQCPLETMLQPKLWGFFLHFFFLSLIFFLFYSLLLKFCDKFSFPSSALRTSVAKVGSYIMLFNLMPNMTMRERDEVEERKEVEGREKN